MNNKELLRRYIERTATEQERNEFFRRLQAGEYDEEGQIDNDVRKAIEAEQTTTTLAGQQLIDRVKAKVLAEIEPQVILIQRKERSRVWLAAASVIVIMMVAGVWVLNTKGYFAGLTSQQEAANPIVYKNKQVINLPDGTKVVLNANSELRLERSFGTDDRQVSLIGEASFDVTHNAAKPFIVHTGKVSTKVLGTAFNINAWPDQRQVTVTVVRGLVQVGDDQQHVYDKISPNEQITVDVASSEFVKKNTDAEKALAWQSNFLILHDVTMEEAAKIIGEKFDVQIALENEALKNCRLDATFLNDEALSEVLTLVGEALNIKFTTEKDGSIMLHGKGCD